jgi:DNA-binding transcriptional LysR family regulator
MVVDGDIQSGRLLPVLQEYELTESGIYIVYPHRERMPAKLRVFSIILPAGMTARNVPGGRA